jgi:hypothetical protein
LKVILIPSKGRPNLRNATADMLVAAGHTPAFVVPESEHEAYRKGNPHCFIFTHPDELLGLPKAMKFALDLDFVGRSAIICDDDLVFYNRFDGTTRLPRNMPEETQIMVEWLYAKAAEYGHATISPAQFNNAHPDDFEEVCAARSVLAFDLELLRRERIEIDRVPSKNDYDITLQLFRKGIKNICAYNMCHKQVAGPNLKGGCTPYRNEALHQEASEKLAALHPGYVKVVVKTKPQWPFPRHDVTIQWKKAYNDGLRSILG